MTKAKRRLLRKKQAKRKRHNPITISKIIANRHSPKNLKVGREENERKKNDKS